MKEKKNSAKSVIGDLVGIIVGSAMMAAGFDIFLRPCELNGGGMTGLAMIICELTGFKSVGLLVALFNVPLFLLGWKQIGREFFWKSLIGMAVSATLIDLFEFLPMIEMEPLIGGLYGGLISGVGIAIVFLRNASTGGSDIVARLVRCKLRHAPIGKIMFAFDCGIVILTGLVFKDISKTLYSAVALFFMSQATDMVIYGRNDSGVALIISDHYQEIADAISEKLDRGATLLPATGAYTNKPKTVVLVAVKSQQVGPLQALAAKIDPDAFVIMQKAHQVLGDGFGRYSPDGL